MTHYHYATGIPGYGPDGADGYACCETLSDLADGLRDELRDLADMLEETAHAHAETHDYADAWHAHEKADSLEILRANLDPARAQAPLYRDDPAAWQATLERIVSETFPLSISNGPSLALYAWPCDESECDHCDED